MGWMLLMWYFIGAGITFLLVYTIFVKKYIKEKSALNFSFWLNQHIMTILLLTIWWVVVLPVMVALSPILIAIKLINKYYNIEL